MQAQSTSIPKPKQTMEPKYAKVSGKGLQILSSSVSRKRQFYNKTFNHEIWDLSTRGSAYRVWNANEILPFLIQSSASQLHLDYNLVSNIMISILDIYWKQLKILNLGDNLICSIQSICLIWMPNLNTLRLNNNPITEIRSLRKCNIPHLSTLCITNIPLKQQLNLISLSELNSPSLSNLIVYNKNGQKPLQLNPNNCSDKRIVRGNWGFFMRKYEKT